jgi:monoamine oxidase
VSLLNVLFLIHAHRNLETLQSSRGGVEQDRIQGGAQSIANRIAAELGEQVRLEAPVRAIAQDADGVTVRADIITVRARRVIVALPPVLTGHLRYDPMLPVDRLLLNQRVPSGAIMRAVTVYDEPFWRVEGLSGHAIALNSPVSYSIDMSPESGRPRMLNSYAAGPAGRALGRMDAAERAAHVHRCAGGPLRAQGGCAHPLHRGGLGERGVDAGWDDHPLSSGRPYRVRPGATRAGGAHPLGLHRDGADVACADRGRRALR